MIRIALAGGLAAALAAGTAGAAPETYNIDPRHTFPSYELNHMGYSLQRGRFDRTEGVIELDLEAHKGSVDVAIDAASVSTGVPKLDENLRGADFFDAERYPKITFKSSDLVFEGDTLRKANGDLTIHGVTRPVTFEAGYFRCAPSLLLLRKACGADLTARIRRSDFDMKYGIPMVGDEVLLRVNVEALGPR